MGVTKTYKVSERSETLSWSYHLIASYAPDPRAALELAEDEGLSVRRLAKRCKVPIPYIDHEIPLVAANSGNGEDDDEWYTPSEYVEAARELMGSIDLDPASSVTAQEKVQALSYYTLEDDGLTKDWPGRVWLNPPYSYPLVEKFVFHAIAQYASSITKAGVILTNNHTDAGWFHQLLERFPVCFTRGRIPFWQPNRTTSAARQGQAFFYMGGDLERFDRIFSRFGAVVSRVTR